MRASVTASPAPTRARAVVGTPDFLGLVATGAADPVAGKVMVALALCSTRPLLRVMRASHGPAGSALSRAIVTGSVSPIASVARGWPGTDRR